MKRIISLIIFLNLNFALTQTTPVLMPGFPITLDSSDYTYNNGPIVADFNNDGENEILVGVNNFSNVGKVLLIDKGGNFFANFPKIVSCFASYIWVAAGDIDNDGFLDIVIKSDSLYVFNYLGNPLPGFPTYIPHSFNSLGDILGIYDLDNDGNLEIILAKKNKITIVNNDGKIRIGWPITIDQGGNTFISYFAVGDLNNDNIAEIIFPSSNHLYQTPNLDSNKIFIYEPDGSPYLNSPIVSDSGYYFEHYNYPVIFTENNKTYFSILSNYSSTRTPGNYRSRFTIYDNTGNVVIRKNFVPIFNTESMTMGKFDNSEPFFVFGELFYSFGFNIKGNQLPGFPILTSGNQYRSHSIGKLTDKYCFASSESQDTLGGMGLRGYLKFWDMSGIPLSWATLRPKGIPGTEASFCDLNGDNQVEVLSTTNGYINGGEGCGLYVWTFPGVQYSRESFPWSMFGHDRFRTNQLGFIPPDDPVGINPISAIVPDKFSLDQNYPNPFNPTTTIKFNIPSNSNREIQQVILIVYDALGRIVETLVNQKLNTGEYSVTFDGKNLSSGVYFYRLSIGAFTNVKRLILLK